MRKAIPSLTGLRFVAAMCVLIGHAVPKIIPFPPSEPSPVAFISSIAAEGMTLFFVLSGFVIFYNYSERVDTPKGIYNFFVARFSRLYPLYVIGITYDLLIKVSHYQFSSADLDALPFYATLTQSWFYLAINGKSLVYQYGLVPTIAWSISTEWFFYIVFPLVCFAVVAMKSVKARMTSAALVAVAAVTIVSTIVLNGSAVTQFGIDHFGQIAADPQESFFRWVLYFSPYVRVFEFVIGCLCASIVLKLKSPSESEERVGAAAVGLSLAAIVLLHWMMFFQEGPPTAFGIVVHLLHMNFGFAVPLAVLIFCCARYHNVFSKMISHPLLVLCGEASFSLYLLHLIVIDAFRYEAAPVTLPLVAIGGVIRLLIVLAACVGLSLVSYRLIEVPSRRLLRRWMTISEAALPASGTLHATT